jgi:hypothetical protein
MYKTLKIVIAATVIPMTAVSVMFNVSDRSTKFNDWANNTQQGANCELKQAEFQNACDCNNPGDTPDDAKRASRSRLPSRR